MVCGFRAFGVPLDSTQQQVQRGIVRITAKGNFELPSEAYQATASYVMIMVYNNLIILGLQPHDFPASRLHTMSAFVALAKVRSTCCFHRRVESSEKPKFFTVLAISSSLLLLLFLQRQNFVELTVLGRKKSGSVPVAQTRLLWERIPDPCCLEIGF